MSFYKTNNPEVMAALDDYLKQKVLLRKECREFAERFCATDFVVLEGISSGHFHGIRFDTPKDRRFWTVPDKDYRTQRPRKSVPGMTPDEKLAHAELLREWGENKPNTRISAAGVYESLGTDWGQLLFGGGFRVFLHDGFVYIRTGVKLADFMQEILGSEYEAAVANFEIETKGGAK